MDECYCEVILQSGHGRLARQMTLLIAFCDYLGNCIKVLTIPCSITLSLSLQVYRRFFRRSSVFRMWYLLLVPAAHRLEGLLPQKMRKTMQWNMACLLHILLTQFVYPGMLSTNYLPCLL